jgi:hypothetical protein
MFVLEAILRRLVLQELQALEKVPDVPVWLADRRLGGGLDLGVTVYVVVLVGKLDFLQTELPEAGEFEAEVGFLLQVFQWLRTGRAILMVAEECLKDGV